MKKNAHIHIVIETEYLNKLIEEARDKLITISELCRRKLREDTKLDKILMILEQKNGKEITPKPNN